MTCVVHNDLLLFESVTPVLGNYKMNDKVWPPSSENQFRIRNTLLVIVFVFSFPLKN